MVETGLKGWMRRARNCVMVGSLGLHRIEVGSYWGLVARVNLILLVHSLFRSRVLLKMAGVELGSSTRRNLSTRHRLCACHKRSGNKRFGIRYGSPSAPHIATLGRQRTSKCPAKQVTGALVEFKICLWYKLLNEQLKPFELCSV